MPIVEGELKPFWTFGPAERSRAAMLLESGPLSGYLGGVRKGGYWVERLEEEWAAKFKVKHAIACNSATSGLLLACMAARIGPNSKVMVSPYTMSATAAAPKFLGAKVEFGDIEPKTFSFSHWPYIPDAAIITNLFGHPGYLQNGREVADQSNKILIEDNAQAPLAIENGVYAGTIGHIGVFSLNVHKHIQVGEGGVCVTNDDNFAYEMRAYRNHAEMANSRFVGLNLRMTELHAALATVQLARAEQIVSERIEIAKAIMDAIGEIPNLVFPTTRVGCRHVFYCIPWQATKLRDLVADRLEQEGVPVSKGYLTPLYRLPAFQESLPFAPVTEQVENQMLLYENCAYSPTTKQIKQIGQVFQKVFGELDKNP